MGAELVDKYLGAARADVADGRTGEAADALVYVDGLRGRTAQLGVTLSVPDDYADFRRDTIDAAALALFRQGEEFECAGRWPDAAQTYERLRAYPLTRDQAFRADEGRARVFLRWAEQDMSLGTFRAAYGHAQTALDVFGPDSPTGAEAPVDPESRPRRRDDNRRRPPLLDRPGRRRGDAAGAGGEALRLAPLRAHGRAAAFRRPDRPGRDPSGDCPAARPERALSDRTAAEVGRALRADLVVPAGSSPTGRRTALPKRSPGRPCCAGTG